MGNHRKGNHRKGNHCKVIKIGSANHRKRIFKIICKSFENNQILIASIAGAISEQFSFLKLTIWFSRRNIDSLDVTGFTSGRFVDTTGLSDRLTGC